MMLFGRSKHQLKCLTSEFLPFKDQLHFIVADADINLQILQYDPENPTLQADPVSSTSRHSTPATSPPPSPCSRAPATSEFGGATTDYDEDVDMDTSSLQPLYQVLHTTQSGTIALITPLSEASYRRLSGLSAFLANALDSACGLDPKAFRISDVDDGGWDAGGVGRGIVDGDLLMRWGELGEWRRKEGLSKIGTDEWTFWGEREVLGGWGVFGGRGRGS